MNGAEVQFEDWHVAVQLIAFCIIFAAFLFFSVKTFLMKKDKEKKLASIPLEDESDPPSS